MTKKLNIPLKRLANLGELDVPFYATSGSAGMDLVAAINEDITLKPMQRHAVPTGISIALPEGYEAQIRPRSGMALKHGISVPNAPGTIDADYRGEICVIIVNLSNENFVITRGMRIAQMVVTEYTSVRWDIVDSLEETSRAAGGFGSTGIISSDAPKERVA